MCDCLVYDILSNASTLIIQQPQPGGPVSLSLVARNGRPISIERDNLGEALTAASGKEKQRRCPKCNQVKAAECFPRFKTGHKSQSARRTRQSWCSSCNREKVLAANARKAAEQEQRTAENSPCAPVDVSPCDVKENS